MHHGPTELDNTLRAFEELPVSIVDFTDYFFSGRNLKSAYISSFIYFFKLVCTRWENFIRIGITVLYLKSCRCQLWILPSQIFVKLHLRPSNPPLTSPTLQIQYCYSLNSNSLSFASTWLHPGFSMCGSCSLCCVFLYFVLVLCLVCLCIVHSGLPLRVSLTFV